MFFKFIKMNSASIRILNTIVFVLFILCGLDTISLQAKTLDSKSVDELKNYLLQVQQKKGLPVVAFALVQNNTTLFSASSSIVKDKVTDANTVFPAPSLSEPLISLLAASLESQKILKMDTPARRLDRRFKTKHADDGEAVKLEHLLRQTAGIPSYIDKSLQDNWAKGEDVFTVIRQTPTIAGAGQTFQPGKAGLSAAGFLLASAAGYEKKIDEGYARAMEKYVFKPLGMTQSGFTTGHVFAPVEGFYTNINDLAKWIMFEMNEGRLSDGNAFIASSLMTQRHTPLNLKETRHRCMGWQEHYYMMTRVLSCAGVARGNTVLLGFLPEFKIGFALRIEEESGTAQKLAQEIPLAIVEFLRTDPSAVTPKK